MNRKLLLAATLIACTCSFAFAETDQDRTIRSYQVFCTGIDSLLLDTQHVFVQKGDGVKSVYIKNIGILFTGNISITGSGKFSIVMGDWERWFNKKDSESSTDDADKRKNYISLYEKDQERLKNMDTHIQDFRKELSATILDYCGILTGREDNDNLIIVLHVKDCEFLKKYHTSALVLQANFKDLCDLKSNDPESKAVQRVLKYNL